MSFRDNLAQAPGVVRLRDAVPAPAGYAVFDCETTGTTPGVDEIVSFAVIRLDAAGLEEGRCSHLVRPSRSIPAAATAVHRIGDADVAGAPPFARVAVELLGLLEGAVFVAHNAGFDLPMLRHEFGRIGVRYTPPAVACTLEAYRLLDPLAPAHNLEALCERYGIPAAAAHDSLADATATAELLRLLLAEGIAPETVRLDAGALWRLRSRGDRRPASEAQIRRVFALGHAAGLSRAALAALVERVTGSREIDSLTREQVQDVFEALEQAARASRAA